MRHLVLFTMGPVQEFIAEARRTRDLWFGSHLLSEIARAGARSMADAGARLVFPALESTNPELVPCDGPLRDDGRPPLNVANKILAEVPNGIDPTGIARAGRAGAKERLAYFAVKVWTTGSQGLIAPGVESAWAEQVDSLLECNAAWLPISDEPSGYSTARVALESVIAGRKNLRDFDAWKHQRGAVPKSSLDGARETVLAEQRDRALVAKYRIAPGEELDAIGLIKRAGGEPQQFVPITNVALAAWVELAASEAPEALEHLRRACEKIRIGRVVRDDIPWTRSFSFDAQVFLPSRWPALMEELGSDADPLDWGKTYVRPVLDAMCLPDPYVACVVADGDRIGTTLSHLAGADPHRTFSKQLSRFAAEARRIVEQEHKGLLVYSGGDDVLAFVCVVDALACAAALRCQFDDLVRAVMAQASPDIKEVPTLSVGIGIGHTLEGMGDLIALGREAEKLAKGAELREQGRDRNALAIVIDKRSGGRQTWRAGWGEWGGDPVARLADDIVLLDDRLSSKKVFEVERDLRRLPAPEEVSSPEDGLWAALLARDTARTLARTHAGEPTEPSAVGLELTPSEGYAAVYRQVSGWVRRLKIARALGAAQPTGRRESS